MDELSSGYFIKRINHILYINWLLQKIQHIQLKLIKNMTDIKAIANRNSIVLKIDTSIFERKERPTYLLDRVEYTVSSSGQHSDITNLGVCYYTTNSNEVTYIPFDETQFLFSNINII